MIPPVWFTLAIVAMVLLDNHLPGKRWLELPAGYLGLVVVAAGTGLAAWGAGLFHLRGTGIRPFTPVTRLVLEGPYRFTRNPMYLGMVLVLVGIAVFLGSLTPWLVLPPLVWVLRTLFIKREEAMLEALFDEDYRAYCRQVRRWI